MQNSVISNNIWNSSLFRIGFDIVDSCECLLIQSAAKIKDTENMVVFDLIGTRRRGADE